jgi:hypothetical protein
MVRQISRYPETLKCSQVLFSRRKGHLHAVIRLHRAPACLHPSALVSPQSKEASYSVAGPGQLRRRAPTLSGLQLFQCYNGSLAGVLILVMYRSESARAVVKVRRLFLIQT